MKNAIVIVTGASSGIGKTTALHLAQHGFRVFAGVRRIQDGEALTRMAQNITPITLDVTRPEHIEDCAEMIRQQANESGIKALVNNAGINYISPFELTDPAKARQLFEVNFFGLCHLTQMLIPELRTYAQTHSDTPKIINIGSFGSTMGIPWEPYYHASKFALLGLSESLMFELKRQRIKVATILPGGIHTEFFDKTGLEIDSAIAALTDDQKAHYAHGLEALKRPFQQFKTLASPPELVARAIHRAISANNPRFRQLVGLDAKSMFLMVRFMPTAWRQALLGPLFGA
jgi:short-subunit dehydrogenase